MAKVCVWKYQIKFLMVRDQNLLACIVEKSTGINNQFSLSLEQLSYAIIDGAHDLTRSSHLLQHG